MKKIFLVLCCTLFLVSCGLTKKPKEPSTPSDVGIGKSVQIDNVSYHSVGFNQLPDWQTQNFQTAMASFLQGCLKLQNKPQWLGVCQNAQRIGNDNKQIKTFFEHSFQPWQVKDSNKLEGTVTGYYEPMLKGSLNANGVAQYPIYGLPNDFVVLDFPSTLRGRTQLVVKPMGTNRAQALNKTQPDFGEYIANVGDFFIDGNTKALKGRFEGNRFVPYYTRAQIDRGALNGKAPILGYANDPVELFFLQIQGSGRLQTPEGQFVRLGYADHNGLAYSSIGTYLVKRGELTMGQTSMQGLKAWVQLNPHRKNEVLGVNERYVFFQVLPGNNGGPIGALGVPLTGEYSGAVDTRYITLGSPLFLSTTYPSSSTPLNRLIMAQDTGGAIRGGVRVDFFWGFGDEAGQIAGKMKQQGRVWTLLPRGITPHK